MNSIAASSTAAANAGDIIIAVALILAAFVLYWTPVIVALARHVPNLGSVAVIDGLLGWTVIGWAIALAMAVRSVPPQPPWQPQPWQQPATGPGWSPSPPRPGL